MTASDESAIRQLMDEMTDAWNRGDPNAFGARYRDDGTFTNVNGTFHFGRAEFDRRHDEVFRGAFNDTTPTMTIKKLRTITPNVAAVDIDTTIAGCRAALPAWPVGNDGALHTSLLMVLLKESNAWWVSAYHNVWRAEPR